MDISCTISSTTKKRNSGTKFYRNTFKKILKNKQRICYGLYKQDNTGTKRGLILV